MEIFINEHINCLSMANRSDEGPKGQVLKKEISYFQLVVIAVVASVGTGILFATDSMTAAAGPGSVLSWALIWIFFLPLALTFAELARVFPEAGGPARYPLYTHGRMLALLTSTSSLIWYLFIPPIEALAVVEALDYFYPKLIGPNGYPTLLGAGLGVILLLLFIPFNYYGTKSFARSSTGLGVVKFVFYAALALGLIAVYFNASNFTSYGGFLPYGATGLFLAMPTAAFAVGGVRIITDYAEEVKSTGVLVKAVVLTVFAQLVLTVLFGLSFVGALNWGKLGLSSGDWSSLTSLPGNPFVDLSNSLKVSPLLAIAIVVGTLGPFVTGYIYLGGGTRILFAMSRSNFVSSKIKQLHQKYYVPTWAILIFAIVGAIVTFVSAPAPSIYSLLTDAVVAGYLAYAANPVAMMAARRQGLTQSAHRLPGGSVFAPIGLIFSALIVYWSGWPSVPYSILIITVASILFTVVYRVKENVFNSVWFIVYALFMLVMSYIGSVGALNVIPFSWSSLIVAAVSVLVFYPWGILTALREPIKEAPQEQ
jgi:amino acid transporter